MKLTIIFAAAFVVGCPLALHAQIGPLQLIATERVTVDATIQTALRQRFTEFAVVRLDYPSLTAAVKSGQTRHRLRIENVIDQEVSIELRDLRAPDYKLYLQDDTGLRRVQSQYVPSTYVVRDAAQVAIGRLNLDTNKFEARIKVGENVYYLRTLSKFVATTEADILVVNRLQDAVESQNDVCDAENAIQSRMLTTPSSASPAAADYERCVQLEIAGAGDHTLFNIHGVFGTESTVFDVINLAEHIYLSEFGLPITVTGNVISVTDDPYDSSDSHTLLASFKDHWNELGVDIKRDMAILVSGKNLEGGTKGRAYIGVAGFPEEAYGVVQSPGTDHLDYVVAHEIGHSLDAQHDESGCAHLLANNRWVMCPWVGTKDFSSGTRNAIINYVNSHLELFVSEYTLASDPFVDGNLTQGELHSGGNIITDEYFLNDPSHEVTLVSRTKVIFKSNTRITNGAYLRARIDPSLSCTSF